MKPRLIVSSLTIPSLPNFTGKHTPPNTIIDLIQVPKYCYNIYLNITSILTSVFFGSILIPFVILSFPPVVIKTNYKRRRVPPHASKPTLIVIAMTMATCAYVHEDGNDDAMPPTPLLGPIDAYASDFSLPPPPSPSPSPSPPSLTTKSDPFPSGTPSRTRLANPNPPSESASYPDVLEATMYSSNSVSYALPDWNHVPPPSLAVLMNSFIVDDGIPVGSKVGYVDDAMTGDTVIGISDDAMGGDVVTVVDDATSTGGDDVTPPTTVDDVGGNVPTAVPKAGGDVVVAEVSVSSTTMPAIAGGIVVGAYVGIMGGGEVVIATTTTTGDDDVGGNVAEDDASPMVTGDGGPVMTDVASSSSSSSSSMPGHSFPALPHGVGGGVVTTSFE
jgi:hypothetical protein